MLLPILYEPRVRQPDASPYPIRAASAATKFFSLSYTSRECGNQILLPILHEPQVRQPNSSPYPIRAASAATRCFSLSYTAVKISPPTVFRKPPIVFRKPPILLRGHRPDFPKAPKLHPQKGSGKAHAWCPSRCRLGRMSSGARWNLSDRLTRQYQPNHDPDGGSGRHRGRLSWEALHRSHLH